ncbi:WD40-repeat-containing domain protein [Tribonema minus]|uniref:WD40-repeat-containing domain protein n=1 Tax=Tribonema minus TaxID=303371 RepID=A0A836CGS2_9STRA|nr:WD40-repeat-containing domain protein [Tribonema minus]
MKIVGGTLEGFLYGFDHPDDEATAPDTLSMAYGYKVHAGCVKSLAIAEKGTLAGKMLVTGGTDERIRIYDLGQRTEKGELQQHSGTVTCLAFHDSTHLLSGSEDKTICIWRVHDWALLHVLGGHKGAVTDLSIHPSGRMALSVSTDRTLRLWNLVEGRAAYIKRLPGGGDMVRWSPQGTHFAVVVGKQLILYEAAASEPACTRSCPLKINAMAWLNDTTVAAAADDHVIRVYSATGDVLAELPAEAACGGRVRDMAYTPTLTLALGLGDSGGAAAHDPEETAAAEVAVGASALGTEQRGRLVTVTSTGTVQVWELKLDGGSCSATVVAHTRVLGEPRFTCLVACDTASAAAAAASKKGKKRKRALSSTAAAAAVLSENDSAQPTDSVGRQDADQGERHKKKKKGKKGTPSKPEGRGAAEPSPQGEAGGARSAGKGKSGPQKPPSRSHKQQQQQQQELAHEGTRASGKKQARAAKQTPQKKNSPAQPPSQQQQQKQRSAEKAPVASSKKAKKAAKTAVSQPAAAAAASAVGTPKKQQVGFSEVTPGGKSPVKAKVKLAKGTPAPKAAMKQKHKQTLDQAAKSRAKQRK